MKPITKIVLIATALVLISCCNGSSSKKELTINMVKDVCSAIFDTKGDMDKVEETYILSFMTDDMKKSIYYDAKISSRPELNHYDLTDFKQSYQLVYDKYELNVVPSSEEKDAFIVTCIMNPDMKDGELIEIGEGYECKWKQITTNLVKTIKCEDGEIRIDSYKLLESKGI